MNEFQLTVLLHPSIESKDHILTGKINSETRILDGIISVLKIDENVAHLLVIDNEIKPGYLLISDKRELKTTGIINEIITSDMDVRIIPISHGG
ncbi:MAG: hypothetical protein GOP50_10780 [Candidatus Heimdallarchaeota archaeon]|nr:hypothetical protein [Candidatus Heimdallarchaeota archaeon]